MSATNRPTNILLSGIVGSTAYGLAGPDSDVDRFGIYAEPTRNFWGLKTPEDSYVEKDPLPDLALHEARKYVHLALRCNPTVLELMWLPSNFVEVLTPHGASLRIIRENFLSAYRVRSAYLGYASQQLDRMKSREAGARTAKHARHLGRLLIQGTELYRTGNLRIELHAAEVDMLRGLGAQAEGGDFTEAEAFLSYAEEAFETGKTVLPEEPNTEAVEHWLHAVRADFL